MTEKEFVTWFKGFVAAANTYNITPKQWDTICEFLEKVKDTDKKSEKSEKYSRYTLDMDANNSNWTTTAIIANDRNDISYKTDNLETKTILND